MTGERRHPRTEDVGHAETFRVLDVAGRVAPKPRVHYLTYDFELPRAATSLTATLRYRKERLCQLFLSLFDSSGGYRGTRMDPAGYGDIVLELRIADEAAGPVGPGGLAGPLPPGRYRALIDVERTEEVSDYRLEVIANYDDHREDLAATAALHVGDLREQTEDGKPTPHGVGWYRGELHTHTVHSDGRTDVEEVVGAARAARLDFLALTDHFTSSGWGELSKLAGPDLAVLCGTELTGHSGHANLHGAGAWVNPFVDGPAMAASGEEVGIGPGGGAWGINDAAWAVRVAGGLFCVNHPFAGSLGWRYHEFDWTLADLMEVYHHQEGPHNALALGLWDEQLRQGRRIVGVAGTDSHHPRQGRHALGLCATYVHAPELSEAGILAGLRAGRVYASLGPTLEFWAEDEDGRRVEMGGEVSPGGPLRLRAEVDDLSYAARLHLLKNGFHHEDTSLEPGGAAVEFEDVPTGPGYYRLEVHAVRPQEPYSNRRSPESVLVVSNPIFVA